MTTQYKALIAALMLLFIAPSTYAGRGPDEAQFQQRIQKMDTLIEQAGAAATPAEREKLLAQHMQEMRACMNMMKGGGGMGMQSGKGVPGMSMDDRMMDVEKRMDMMQMMMDQMMKQQEESRKK